MKFGALIPEEFNWQDGKTAGEIQNEIEANKLFNNYIAVKELVPEEYKQYVEGFWRMYNLYVKEAHRSSNLSMALHRINCMAGAEGKWGGIKAVQEEISKALKAEEEYWKDKETEKSSNENQ